MRVYITKNLRKKTSFSKLHPVYPSTTPASITYHRNKTYSGSMAFSKDFYSHQSLILLLLICSLFGRLPSTSADSADELKNNEKVCVHPFNTDVNVRRGVLGSECSQIMKDFFRRRRKQGSSGQQVKLSVPSYLAMKSKFVQSIASFFKLFGFLNR